MNRHMAFQFAEFIKLLTTHLAVPWPFSGHNLRSLQIAPDVAGVHCCCGTVDDGGLGLRWNVIPHLPKRGGLVDTVHLRALLALKGLG